MSKLNITTGEYKLETFCENTEPTSLGVTAWTGDKGRSVVVEHVWDNEDDYKHSYDEIKATLELLVDAGNVRQKLNCDLPELLEQRNELLEALQSLLGHHGVDNENKAHAAIAKALKQPSVDTDKVEKWWNGLTHTQKWCYEKKTFEKEWFENNTLVYKDIETMYKKHVL